MKQLPGDSIELLTKGFKKIIPPEKIVTAIMNTTENKDGEGNFNEILNYLRELIKEDVQDKNNVFGDDIQAASGKKKRS